MSGTTGRRSERPREDDPRPTADLVRLALEATDEDAAWDHVVALHHRGGRGVYTAACALLKGHTAAERALGADILGQLGGPERPFLEESFTLLTPLLEREKEAPVVASVVVALKHLDLGRELDEYGDEAQRAVAARVRERWGETVLESLVHLAHHPDAEVRFATAWALPCFTVRFDGEERRAEDPRGIAALETLAQDEDDEIRDWATFGLGTMLDADSPQVRDALAARLRDADDETRHEAILGLARRHDPRALEPLLAALGGDTVWMLAVEAARELSDPALAEPLQALREWWGEDEEDRQLLDEAIAACHSGSPAGA